MRLLITGVREVRELGIRALGFLQAQHVHVGALQEIPHPIFPGADRVDVPRSNAHVNYSSALGDSHSAMPMMNRKSQAVVQSLACGIAVDDLQVRVIRTLFSAPSQHLLAQVSS